MQRKSEYQLVGFCIESRFKTSEETVGGREENNLRIPLHRLEARTLFLSVDQRIRYRFQLEVDSRTLEHGEQKIIKFSKDKNHVSR